MRPEDLKPEQFNAYPPEARKLALEYLETFRRLPLSFLPSLLREVIELGAVHRSAFGAAEGLPATGLGGGTAPPR